MNPSEPPELLGPRLTKGEARPLENQAKRHYRAAGRNLARFAADLRRLQDGEAHLTRGFSSFGAYAEHTFDGLSAANAKKISDRAPSCWCSSTTTASRSATDQQAA